MEAYTPGELIESGILLENGETLTSGRIVEIAREAKQLWKNKDYHGFRNLIHNPTRRYRNKYCGIYIITN